MKPGDEHIYYSVDSAHAENSTNLDEILPDEFINYSTPNGVPPHQLSLKVNAMYIF